MYSCKKKKKERWHEDIKKEQKYSLNTSHAHVLHAKLVIWEAPGYQSDTPERRTEAWFRDDEREGGSRGCERRLISGLPGTGSWWKTPKTSTAAQPSASPPPSAPKIPAARSQSGINPFRAAATHALPSHSRLYPSQKTLQLDNKNPKVLSLLRMFSASWGHLWSKRRKEHLHNIKPQNSQAFTE